MSRVGFAVTHQSGSCCNEDLALGSGQRLARSFRVTMPARTPRAIANRSTRTSTVNTATAPAPMTPRFSTYKIAPQ
jgi:hypothetical protein